MPQCELAFEQLFTDAGAPCGVYTNLFLSSDQVGALIDDPGSHRGVAAVLKSIDTWAAYARLLSFQLLRLLVDGSEAIGIVREHAQCLANNNEYDVYVATNITIEGGKITHYRTYWDISPLIKAFRNI